MPGLHLPTTTKIVALAAQGYVITNAGASRLDTVVTLASWAGNAIGAAARSAICAQYRLSQKRPTAPPEAIGVIINRLGRRVTLNAVSPSMLLLVSPPFLRAFHRLRRIWWRIFRPHAEGVMVIAVTPNAKLVLVRHTYAPGWHLPGGGKKKRETPEFAARRELREEIGLRSLTDFAQVADEVFDLGGRQVRLYVFVARNVVFMAKPSFEIAEIRVCNVGGLPADSQFAVRIIDLVRQRHPGSIPRQ